MHHRHVTSQRRSPWTRLLAVLAALMLVATACGDDDGDEGARTDGAGDQPGAGKTVRIGIIPWDEDVAVTHLWKHILEERGYTVELTQLDVAPVYAGLAEGDLDLFLDAWLPATHSDYLEQYGDRMEDLGIWYDQATLNIAVPEYVDATSLEDLKGQASQFDGRIVGIEPGAGLMRITRNEVIPQYELTDYTLTEGSTPAMLAELERAIDREEPVVVTLWHPHWAYAAFPIKDLEDPKNALGDAEEIHAYGKQGFSDDFPEVAEWIGNFEMNDEALAALEELVINEFGDGQEDQAVQQWLEDPDHRQLVDDWTSEQTEAATPAS